MELDFRNEIKKSVIKSQHTQRNWDLSKSIPEEDIDVLVHAVTNCPSKQNFAFYKAHFITDRNIIEQVHANSLGLGYADPETGDRVECTNPQTLANLLVAFEANDMSAQYNKKFKNNDESDNNMLRRDREMAVGIAAGYLNVIATMLGYQTGCCACYDKSEVEEILGFDNPSILLMGIGFKDSTRQRREHHTENVKIERRIKEEIPVVFKK
jgi:nitroreductase